MQKIAGAGLIMRCFCRYFKFFVYLRGQLNKINNQLF